MISAEILGDIPSEKIEGLRSEELLRSVSRSARKELEVSLIRVGSSPGSMMKVPIRRATYARVLNRRVRSSLFYRCA